MHTALRYMEKFAPYDPYWIEASFSLDQIDNHANLVGSMGISVATCEVEAGQWRFKEFWTSQRLRSQPDATPGEDGHTSI